MGTLSFHYLMVNSVLTLKEQRVFMFEFAVTVLDLEKGTN